MIMVVCDASIERVVRGDGAMSTFDMKVAVVRSANNLQYDPTRDLTKKLEEGANSDTRYRNAVFKTVAWDSEDTTDWTEFSHIVLALGLKYSNKTEEFMTWLNNLPNQDRVFNPPSLIKWNINKIYLKQMRRRGVLIPASVFIPQKDNTSITDVVKTLEEESGRKVEEIIIKDMIDAGGYSVYRIKMDEESNAQATLNRATEGAQGGVMAQEYLPAIVSEGEWSLVYFNRALSHVVLKKPSEGGFRVQKQHGGSYSAVSLSEVPGTQLASSALETVQEPKLLYARVDIVRDHNRNPCLMELEVFEPDLYLTTTELSKRFLDILRSY